MSTGAADMDTTEAPADDGQAVNNPSQKTLEALADDGALLFCVRCRKRVDALILTPFSPTAYCDDCSAELVEGAFDG